MSVSHHLTDLGFTRYEVSCYLALLEKHPLNGSQLSRLSGVTRSKIYDVLHKMKHKGLVAELEDGLFAPLPPEELMNRLRSRFDTNMDVFWNHVKNIKQETSYDFVWTIRGYDEVMAKARQMIGSARSEIYLRIDRREALEVLPAIREAEKRGAAVRYVSLGPPPHPFEIQVIQTDWERQVQKAGGRPIDIIIDRNEALVGMFETGLENSAGINSSRNRWFINASRDSVRHDFFRYFLHQTADLSRSLSPAEQKIYDIIKSE